MKNLKKVLALVLAFACAFTMLAGAVVYPDVPAGSDFSEAITMLSDLGVITGDTDGKYHPENTITRAEACALIARLLTGETDVSKYQGASNFPDVAKTSWYEPAVGFCVASGITRGYPDGTFKPAVQITDAEFVTMLVRAMGYETAANPLSYPYGYITAAQTAGLLEGVTVVPASGALRGEDAQMLYNAMFADYARGAKFVNTTHGTTIESYPTIAQEVFGLNRAAVGTSDKSGQLENCKAHTWAIVGTICLKDQEDKIVAMPISDNKTEKYDETLYVFSYSNDIAPLVGYQVELWGEGAHGQDEYKSEKIDGEKYMVASDEWEIKAVKTVKGQTHYDYNPTLVDDKVDGTLKFEENEVDLDNVQNFTMYEDGVYATANVKNTDDKAIEEFVNVKNSASYDLFDWDSDGSVDYISGSIYNYYKVESISSKTVRLSGFDGKTAYTLDKDGETDVKVNGETIVVKADVEALEEGDFVQVSVACESTKKNVVHTWTIEVVEPSAKEVTKVSSNKGVYFDDELIEVADAKSGNPQYYFEGTGETKGLYYSMNENTEDNWDVLVDANGYVINLSVSDTNWTGYLYVTGAANGDGKNTGSRKQALVSGKNDKNEVLEDVEIAKKAVVTDGKGNDLYDSSDYKFKDDKGQDSEITGRVFRYIYDEESKEITKMEQVANDAKVEDYSHLEKTHAAKVESKYVDPSDISGNYWMDGADVIFVVAVDDTYYGKDSNNRYGNVAKETLIDPANNNANTGKDIDVDDVIVVDYKEIPDIDVGVASETHANTYSRGLTFDLNKSKDMSGAVLLGVDKLDYFTNSSTKVALMTELIANKRNDNYEITAFVAGADDAVETTTIDYNDVKLNGAKATKAALDAVCNQLNNGDENDDNDKNGMYVELKFNKDGKVTAINTIDQDTAWASSGASANVADSDKVNPTYTVVRAVVNRRHADNNVLMMAPGKSIADGKDMKLESIRNSGFITYANIKSDTAFFNIEGQPRMDVSGLYMNAYTDAFDKKIKVTVGDDADLDSFIRNLDEEYSDEYVVADVVLKSSSVADNQDVVAVYAYEDRVAEYGTLSGSVKVNNYEVPVEVNYDEANYTVTVECSDPAMETGSEYIKLYSTLNGAKDQLIDTYNVASKDLKGVLTVGEYYVEGWAHNKRANQDQLIAGGTLKVLGTSVLEADATVTIMNGSYQDIVLSGVKVANLPKENFEVYVGTVKLNANDYDFRYDSDAKTYNFQPTKKLQAGETVKIKVVNVPNYADGEATGTVDGSAAELPSRVDLNDRDADAALDNGSGGLFEGVNAEQFISYTVTFEELGLTETADVTIKQTNAALNAAYPGSFTDNTKTKTYNSVTPTETYSFLVGVDQKTPVKLEVTIGETTKTFTFAPAK